MIQKAAEFAAHVHAGALRKGIHEYLRRQKHVKSYRLAEYGEGDAGVTIVELK